MPANTDAGKLMVPKDSHMNSGNISQEMNSKTLKADR
jgi:hypothetical protein